VAAGPPYGPMCASCAQVLLWGGGRQGRIGCITSLYCVLGGGGGALVAAFQASFLSEEAVPQLCGEDCLGLIVLIWKGLAKPRDLVDSYGPLTLLNYNVCLVKAMVLRWGPQLASVIARCSAGPLWGGAAGEGTCIQAGGGIGGVLPCWLFAHAP
jgi:hypothetical protein